MQLSLTENFTKDEVLLYVLNGLRLEKARLDAKIAEIDGELNGVSVKAAQTKAASRARLVRLMNEPSVLEKKKVKKGSMSAAGRAAIAAAQKKRWAKLKRKAKGPKGRGKAKAKKAA